MSKRRKRQSEGTMLDLWRPPAGAGIPIGCLATTYTFDAGLFDEQCLARFLEVESEPNREDLAFLLERETRLGGVYAGILVDQTQAGVEHSLRWDVLPVRIHGGKQHAKISLLAWSDQVRIIVASANLTEPGYRTNLEVAHVLEMTPDRINADGMAAACQFLRRLLAFVPGASPELSVISRATEFLDDVERRVSTWRTARKTRGSWQHLAFTLPSRSDDPAAGGPGFDAQSSLSDAIYRCRQRGGSPTSAWIASPFFDENAEWNGATQELCKAMARGITRRLTFCVPSDGPPEPGAWRLAAPRSLMTTPSSYSGEADFEVLPQSDADKNRRPWHAKMLALRSDAYTALMAGSSNFTRAGLGIGRHRNAEANLLTIVERRKHAREPGDLEAIWPEMAVVDDPETAEWKGPDPELDEEQRAEAVHVPAGFLTATYHAGDKRQIVLRLAPDALPATWSVHAADRTQTLLVDQQTWADQDKPSSVTISWSDAQPPAKLLVRWDAAEAFWPINVKDARLLPPPAELASMSADDMLFILAASDPSAAFRAWAKQQRQDEGFDDELDTATPADLDPLKRYDLRVTFLRRVRSRARVLARLRENLERPVWGEQALQWRLQGFIGIEPLARRLLSEVANANGRADESLLTLADFLIVLHEVNYQPSDGSLSRKQYDAIFRPFLRELVGDIDQQLRTYRGSISGDLTTFWERVVSQCRS